MIQRKLKECSGKGKAKDYEGCGLDSYLFGHGLCKKCYNKWYSDKDVGRINSSSDSPYKNKKRKSINPVSDKELVRLAKYRKVRDKFMEDKELCEICQSSTPSDVHHRMNTRLGDALWDVNQFMAVCRGCHTELHDNHKWAVGNGYLGSLEERVKYEKQLKLK